MGASCWSYFVPYQRNIEKAFEELRQKVFEEGNYYKPDEDARIGYARGLFEMGDIDKEELEAQLGALEPASEPKTIQELQVFCGEEGTHSILDIEKVSFGTDHWGNITPLSLDEYQDVLGTRTPTRALVEQEGMQGKLQDLRHRGCGVYVVLYKGEEPDEILFTGFSGD